jgi:isopenicillin-N epimerase
MAVAPLRLESSVGAPPSPLAEGDLAALFPWDRSYVFLNHGSFGSVPHEVRAAQDRWRSEIEARPIEMLGRRIGELLEPARAAVAGFVGTDPNRLGFVVNATDGINAVLRSLSWRAGDEIVVLDHVYNAMRQSVRRLGDEFGVEMRVVSVPLPVRGPEDFVRAVVAAFGPRTRMVLIDHITSPTALVVPVARIVEEARSRGIYALVDGAHAPGSIELAVDAIGADAYTANLHKWCCAPKGCAFLSVSGARADSTHALATSHPYREGFVREFEWQGTRDMTPWLAAPAALAFFDRFGWRRVREHNHAMATWSQAFLSECWDTEPLSPRDGSMLASMAPIAVPEAVQHRFESVAALQAHLYAQDRIELPVIDWHGRWHVRVSCHIHTAPWMVERLAEAVRTLARA